MTSDTHAYTTRQVEICLQQLKAICIKINWTFGLQQQNSSWDEKVSHAIIYEIDARTPLIQFTIVLKLGTDCVEFSTVISTH